MTTASRLPLVACSLDSDGQRERLAEWEHLLSEATTAAKAVDGVRYSFAATDAVEQRVRELAAAEKQCCAFLDFDIARTADAVELGVTSTANGLEALRIVFPA